MRRSKRQFVALLWVGLASALTAFGTAKAQDSACELCVEHSPAKAGRVTPDTGTYRYQPNSIVTLSAEPQPGYQFAYWIGDVSNPKTPNTTVRLDTSKIVVAVFKPAPIEEPEPRIAFGGGGGGGGALIPTKVDLSTPNVSIGGGSPNGGTKRIVVPVPIHTPEPATALLLAFGALALRRRSR